MAPNRSHYQTLGVTPETPEREIKRAYHRLARQLHPDKAGSREEARRLEQEFAAISTAYNVLKDKDRRREYDEQQRKASPSEAAPASPAAAEPQGSAQALDQTQAGPAGRRRVPQGEAKEARITIAKKAFARGTQFFQLGEYARAIEFFEAAIQNNDSEALYHARLSKALMNARRSFTRAREMALRAIELDPYNIEYRLTLGEICEMAGSQTLAIQAYKDVLRWDAGNAEALSRLALLERSSRGSILQKILGKIRKR